MRRNNAIGFLFVGLVLGSLIFPFLPGVVYGDDSRNPRLIRVSGREMSRKLVDKNPPIYPPDAIAKHLEGVVRLKVIVGISGVPRQLEVISGHPLLVKAALNAVRQWRYDRTVIDNETVEVITEVDVNFKLN